MGNIERRPEQGYTEEQIDRALVEVALCAGNTRAASRNLKAAGTPVPFQTLHGWVTKTQTGRYQQLRAELVPRIHAKSQRSARTPLSLPGNWSAR